MITLNIRQIRASIGKLDKLVEQAGEILVVRYGEPIVRIVPIHAKQHRPSHAELRHSMSKQKTTATQIIRQDRKAR